MSVGIVAFMSLNLCSPQGVRTLFIYYYIVYRLFDEFIFWICDSYVLVVQRRCNLTCDLYAFEFVHTIFYLWYGLLRDPQLWGIRLTVCEVEGVCQR